MLYRTYFNPRGWRRSRWWPLRHRGVLFEVPWPEDELVKLIKDAGMDVTAVGRNEPSGQQFIEVTSELRRMYIVAMASIYESYQDVVQVA